MVNVDVAVVGGGIQGLLLLRELLARGHSSVLVTNAPLGAGQTLHSHGALVSGIGLITGGLSDTVEAVSAPHLRRLGADVRVSPAFLAIPDPMASDLAPVWRANGYRPDRREPSSVSGLEPGVPPYQVASYNVGKRRLVKALSAGLDPQIVGGEMLGADEALHVRTVRGEDLRLRPAAVVVAAGCGTKALLRERFGIADGVVDRITYTKMQMVCLRAPAGLLPVIGAVVAPDLFVAAHQGESTADGVTWFVTPVSTPPVVHAEAPGDAGADVEPALVAAAIEALKRLFPALRRDDARVQATVFAGYKQDLDGEPLRRFCEVVDPDRNLVVALPSVLPNAVPNAVDAVALLGPRVAASGGTSAVPGAGGVAVGEPDENRRDDWRAWGAFVRAYGG